MGVSLAICEQLESMNIPNIKIKWPNDILSGNRKICGILIENILLGPWVRRAVIGIGLNVNQESFGELSRAGSLRTVTGTEFDRKQLLQALIGRLCTKLDALEGQRMADLMPNYGRRLFRKDLPSAFKNADGQTFMGIPRGVGEQGKLRIELEDGTLREVGLKEVDLLY